MKNSQFYLAISGILALGSAAPVLAADVDISLLLVSDIYAMEQSNGRGGFAKAAAVARSEREKQKNMLYFHAGDTLSPSLMSSLDMGQHVVELLNIHPPDIFIPGNHEFDFGPEVFNKLILNELSSEVVGSNIRDGSGNEVDGITKGKIFDFEGVKVGVFGLLTPDTVELSSPGADYSFLPLLETASETSSELRDAGADIVVLVSHTSFSEDEMLVEQGAIDVLLSGHDHDLRVEFNGDVAFAEPRSDAENMVAVDLKVSVSEKDGKRRVRWWPNFRIIDTLGYEPDPQSQTKTDGYLAQLEAELDSVIGTTSTALDTRRNSVRGGETAFGNLLADSMRESVNADVGLANGGGIRANREYEAGSQLTRRTILEELPFGNTLTKLELSGAQLLAALENGVSRIEEGAGRFPQVSGMSFELNAKGSPGSRVSNLRIGGDPVKLDSVYTVATNNYMAGGGDGYSTLTEGKVLLGGDDSDSVARILMGYIVDAESVSPKVEGRIVLR